jgi:hypothetical protein
MKFKIVYREENQSIFPWKSRFRGVVLWPYMIMRPRKYATGSIAALLSDQTERDIGVLYTVCLSQPH